MCVCVCVCLEAMCVTQNKIFYTLHTCACCPPAEEETLKNPTLAMATSSFHWDESNRGGHRLRL